MIIKINSNRKLQKFPIVCTVFAVLYLSFSNNCYAQIYLDTNKIINTEEHWHKAMDSLFYKGKIDTAMKAWALIRMKIDESGKIMSVHIIKSTNIDTSLFYNICATIEDRYYAPFLRDEYIKFQYRSINGFLYFISMIRLP